MGRLIPAHNPAADVIFFRQLPRRNGGLIGGEPTLFTLLGDVCGHMTFWPIDQWYEKVSLSLHEACVSFCSYRPNFPSRSKRLGLSMCTCHLL